MRRAIGVTRTRWAALWITGVLAAGAIMVTAVAGAGESTEAPAEIELADAPTVDAVEPEQSAEINELGRAERPDDELPERWEQAIDEAGEEGLDWGANPDLSRHTAPGVWIMPADGHVCLASSSPTDGSVGFGCASNEDAERGRLAPSDVDENGNGVLTGIVPDGVASVELVDVDGSTRTAEVDSNTYRAAIDANLKEVRFTDADGARHVLPMEWKP
jgi:hypothetical protein